MSRLLLVDGSNLLFQMFFGMPARITGRDGRAIQGTLGFVGALGKIRRMTQPTHMAVLFDGEHPNDRTALDGAYKANRQDYTQVPDEDSPFSQLPDICRALDFMAIRHTEIAEGETDDAIAAYARTLPQGWELVISSFDSDFFQLVSDRVSVLRYRGDRTVLWDPARLREKYGIDPGQYVDFKSLTGDSADNIPGIPSIGPRTAAALLGTFGDLDSLLARVGEVPRPALQKALREGRERLMTNRRLIRLDREVPMPFSLEALACPPATLTTAQVLEGIGVR